MSYLSQQAPGSESLDPKLATPTLPGMLVLLPAPRLSDCMLS